MQYTGEKSPWCHQSKKEIFAFAEGYKNFLNVCKTEREAAAYICVQAKTAGFENFCSLQSTGQVLQPGQKVFARYQNKAAGLVVMGKEPITSGMRILCAHLDSPRLDIRQKPLYETEGLAMMKTHYYGGIKKYQWTALPLAMHGVFVKKGGERVTVSVGEENSDPVLYISDLPRHLSAQQLQKPMSDGIGGEDLNIVVGSIPLKGEVAQPVRQSVLNLLYQKYKVTEEDFTSAELEIVPAGLARDGGLDNSMVIAYGQDDRACVYPALQAILQMKEPMYSSMLLLVDKEEVGSQGATGMQSYLMENLTAKLLEQAGITGFGALRRALEHSQFLSADVVLGYDPTYSDGYEPANTARIGGGPTVVKYAGHKGKNGCNDASAEFLALLRDVFDGEKICWQTGEYGKIDLGGGGTIAPFAATYGMQVADFGVPLLSMHAPFELASKADIYETYRAYHAFYTSQRTIETYLD